MRNMPTMNNQPLVSVVMSCYNSGKYLREAIDSILEQTYCNFEFIIWDDGSTDNTKAIVESYNDERIHYYYHENTGLGMALRLACQHANGKYIARMDADDISLPNRLMREVEFMENNEDTVLVSSAVLYIDEHGTEKGRTFPCTKDSILKKTLKRTSMIVHPMVMMRRDAYENAGGYIGVKAFEDRIFLCKLSRQGKFTNLTQLLGKYRLLSNSISHIQNPYSSILYAFIDKMIKDVVISDDDVTLYNDIYVLSKKAQKTAKKIEMNNHSHLIARFYKLLGGCRLAEHLICSMKNIYFSYKLRRVRTP